MFLDGKPTAWEKRYDNGRLSSDVHPINAFDGPWIEECYHYYGKLSIRANLGPPLRRPDGLYKRGLLNGLYQAFDEKGHLIEESQYYQGYPLGPQKFYDKKGTLIKTEPGQTKAEIDRLPKPR